MQERWFNVIYPDTYAVPESRVRIWLSDAIANGEVETDLNPETIKIECAISLLHNTGNITFERIKEPHETYHSHDDYE